MNWVLIATGAVILIGFIVGVYRGAIRIAVSLVTTIITLVLVTFLTPHIAKAINEFTPLDEMIQEQVSKAMVSMGTSDDTEKKDTFTEDEVRKVLKAAGISEEQLETFGVSIEDIVKGKVTGDQLARYGVSSSILDGLKAGSTMQEAVESADVPRDMQVAAIEASNLPGLFKTLLSTNNNSEIYEELGVETFAQYVGCFLARLIINIVAFLCTFLLVTIIFRAIIFALDIVSELPVIGFVNRIAGGAAGVLCALVIIWICFIVITLLHVASIGTNVYEMIQENTMLQILYEYNPIMKLATRL